MRQRLETMGEQFRKAISAALIFEMRDPSLKNVTVTRVKISPDLQFADIRVTFLDDGKSRAAMLRSLEGAEGALKRVLSREIKMRRTPKLRFHCDEDVLAERRIDEILGGLEIPPKDDDHDP